MIDLASFFTIQQTTTPQIGVGQGGLTPELAALKLITGKGEGGKEGETSQGIFDLLLKQIEAQISEGNPEQPFTPTDNELLQSDNPTLAKKTKLDIVQLLASNKDIAEDVSQLDDIIGLDLITKIEQTLAQNQQLFDTAIQVSTGNDDLTVDRDTGAISLPDIAEILHQHDGKNVFSPQNISDLVAKIESFIEKADPTLLNTLNITPEQLTTLQNIEAGVVPTEQQVETIEEIANSILIGLVAIVPPAVKQDIVIPPQALKSSGKPASLIPAASTLANDLAARLNNLITGETGERATTPAPFGAEEGDADFEAALKSANGKKYAGNPIVSGEVAPKASPHSNAVNNAAPQAAFNVLEAWPFASSGSLYGSTGFSDQIAEQLGLSLNPSQSAAHGSLTALVNHAQAASQPHPATQAVAASISKAGANGQDTNISLRLDPPDLGRVDVKMTFGKDKSVKAVVTAEKPETFMMLQRDAQVLERALQEAGLDADGGLSFELAEHGFDFDQNNQRGGGHDNGGTGSGEAGEDLEIIESTMTWSVDPETGHTRYDIWA